MEQKPKISRLKKSKMVVVFLSGVVDIGIGLVFTASGLAMIFNEYLILY